MVKLDFSMEWGSARVCFKTPVIRDIY